MADLVWEDPPPSQRGGKAWVSATVTELQEHPGKWAMIRTYPLIKRSSAGPDVGTLKKLGCEATSRKVDDEVRLYARWPEVES